MLALHDVTVLRGDRRLIANISLAMEPGQVTVIVGPNGAGKSTLIRVLSGEIRPSSGVVTLDGHSLGSLPPRRLATRRAVLAQANEAAFGFTVRELAALGLRMLDKSATPPEQTRLIERALSQTGLTELAGRTVGRLSGGERQRAHFARVLVQLWAGGQDQPSVLLLDEPIAAQDLAHQLHILDIARQHAIDGGAVAVVLHDLNWAASIGDRLVVMFRGCIYADGPPASVLTQAMLADVFDVDLPPGATPAPDRPFVLPQLAVARTAGAYPSSLTNRRFPCTSP